MPRFDSEAGGEDSGVIGAIPGVQHPQPEQREQHQADGQVTLPPGPTQAW